MWRFDTATMFKLFISELIQVVKNIVLAGVNLTIQDSGVVTYDELATNFFLNVDVGKQVIGLFPHDKYVFNNCVIQPDCTHCPSSRQGTQLFRIS